MKNDNRVWGVHEKPKGKRPDPPPAPPRAAVYVGEYGGGFYKLAGTESVLPVPATPNVQIMKLTCQGTREFIDGYRCARASSAAIVAEYLASHPDIRLALEKLLRERGMDDSVPCKVLWGLLGHGPEAGK